MKIEFKNVLLLTLFGIVAGALIGIFIWGYLTIADAGITLIWDVIPSYLNIPYYTFFVCLAGGVIVGIFHKFYGPYPETMVDAVKRFISDGRYPYKKIYITVLAAFLSIFFGGAVGPEAGLVCIMIACVSWITDELGMARDTMETFFQANENISKGYVFGQMIKGLFYKADDIIYDEQREWEKSYIIPAGVAAGLVALLTYTLMNTYVTESYSLPHLEESELLTKDYALGILMVVIGIAAGYIFLISRKVTSIIFGAIRGKNLHILNAVLGGAILGLIGTAMPMTMFSGGNDIQTIQYAYLQYTPFLLIAIGVVKLFLTNVCIQSGWRGGHFFPLMFAGVSIGYGFSVLFNTNQVFSVIAVTCALMATVLQQPLGTIALALFFMPFEELPWIVLVSFIAGCIPTPKELRMNPENRGFVYSMIHIKENKFLEMKH